MDVHFTCPECDHPGYCDLEQESQWQCPRCDHRLSLAVIPGDRRIDKCAACGTAALYRKKDFPHWLGMILLVGACLAFLITNYLYRQWLAWGILLGSAAIDCLLYLAVGDAIVCYRCHAQHRGSAPNPNQKLYELSIAERYRQERLRREQIQAERKTSG